MGKIGQLFQYLINKVLGRMGAEHAASVTHKLAMAGLIAAIYAASYATLTGIISGISLLSNPTINTAMTWITPSNANECVGSILAAIFARAVLNYKLDVVKGGK